VQDQQIIDLYWARNEQAIAESEHAYGALCHSVAMNILSDRMDAEECVNDT
jgi:RNA polymerase sigma-70 factor (ECF subfamily)